MHAHMYKYSRCRGGWWGVSNACTHVQSMQRWVVGGKQCMHTCTVDAEVGGGG